MALKKKDRDEVFCGIYGILNTKTGKWYIGSSDDIHYRWYNHRNMLQRGKHHSIKLQRSYDKHGPTAFEYWVLCICHYSELENLENEYLVSHRACTDGYNIRPDAMTNRGHRHSEATKQKIREKLKGKKLPPETCSKMSASRTGMKMDPEATRKSQATKRLRGTHIPSAELRAKWSEQRKGRVMSPETRAKIGEATRLRYQRARELKNS